MFYVSSSFDYSSRGLQLPKNIFHISGENIITLSLHYNVHGKSAQLVSNAIFLKISTSFEYQGECYFQPPKLETKHEKSLIPRLFLGIDISLLEGRRTSIHCQRALMHNFVENKVQKFKFNFFMSLNVISAHSSS